MSWCTRTLPSFFLVRSIPQDPGGFRRDFRGLALRTHPSGGPPGRLLAICLAAASGFWSLAVLRHALPQSNSFDLGIFDQWVWLISRGLAPVSSQSADLPLLTDHGAWLLYGLAPLDALLPDRAVAVGAPGTQPGLHRRAALDPAQDAGLPQGLRWTMCGLWWLQPVVFNTNLFDFHPEVLAMPLLVALVIAGRRQWIGAWAGLILLILGCRDGLALVILGRLALVPESRSALELVTPGDAVATTSYLALHQSGRRMVLFPAASDRDLETLERRRGINLLLLHPLRPGWASEGELQRSLLEQARRRGWSCRSWPRGLQLCRRLA